MEGKLPEKKLLNIYAKSEGDIFFMAELMGQNIQDFIKYVKHYPNVWKKIIDDMSGYIVPEYFVEKYYKIPFEVENIWTSPDELDDLPYTDYKINLLLPKINKLTEKEREDLIAAIYYDCYDLGVDVKFNNKKYNRRDRRITASVTSINGNPLSEEKIKDILDTEDFIDNETIEKLMKKMGTMNESEEETTPCSVCNGVGKTMGKKGLEMCSVCDGTGLDINKDSEPFELVYQNYKRLGEMFCKEFGCEVKNVIGSGSQGVALKVELNGVDKILKITQDNTELSSAKKLYNKNPKHLPVFEKGVGFKSIKFPKASGKIYGLLMDEYVVNNEIIKLVDRTLEYISVLSNDDAVDYLKNTKKGDKKYEMVYNKLKNKQPELVWYFNQLFEVVKELNKFGINSYDFHGMNFGKDKKGNLVYFDIGYDENAKHNEPDEYVLFEKINESKNNEFNPNKFDIDKINKYLSRIKFNEFVSDVEFEGVGEEQGHPVFEISFYVDYYSMYSTNDIHKMDIAEVFYDTLDKVNTIIQMVENPHDKGIWYQIIYDVYSKTHPDLLPMRQKKSYFLA